MLAQMALQNFDIVDFAMWFVAFLLSLTCHEAAHALAARLGGDRTAEDQVTLNPLPHMQREPFGMVVFPLLTYALNGWMMGWASAPYDPYWAQRHPRRAALMALAGPCANFLLAAIAIGVLRFDVAPPGSPIRTFAWIVAVLNALLGAFNLLPLPPLDGASVLSGLGGPLGRAMDALRATPAFGIMGLLLAWQLFRFVSRPVVGVVARLAGIA